MQDTYMKRFLANCKFGMLVLGRVKSSLISVRTDETYQSSLEQRNVWFRSDYSVDSAVDLMDNEAFETIRG